MTTETPAAPNPTEAPASTETPATPAATAAGEPGKGNEQPTDQTAKPAGGDPEAAAKPGDQNQPAAGAPETYEFKAPDGSEYDPKVLEAFSGAAKEANLTQEAAQKLIEKMAPQLAQRQADQVKAIQDGWREQTSSDQEIGGEKLPQNLAVAKKAYDALNPIPQGQTTTPLRTFLETTGLGNHPEIIRLLYRAGKALSEDTIVSGTRTASSPKTLAEKLYGADSK